MARGKKGALKEQRTILFADEAGVYLLPMAIRTWGPVGVTPIVEETLTRDHLSVIAALTPAGQLYTHVLEHAFNGPSIVSFLKQLLRQIPGRLTLLWDGAPIHRSVAVKEFLSEGAAERIRLVPLPGYAPELNPTEGVCYPLKRTELGNVSCQDLHQLHHELDQARQRLRRRPKLIRSFFRHTGYY